MINVLVVVDMQKDFVTGTLGTKEAQEIVGGVVNKINAHNGLIFATFDTHYENYPETSEGRKLPVKHCIKGTDGWQLDERVTEALSKKKYTKVEKLTFGSVDLPSLIKSACGDEDFSIELIGLCTDICVVSNALILKANFPEKTIKVDAGCCAGVTPSLHSAALATMKSCQIDVTGE